MPKIQTALRIFRERGFSGLLRAVRAKYYWLRFAAEEQDLHSNTIDHEQAMRFFNRRRANYLEMIDAVAPVLEPGGTVVDVGGNIGYFTLTLARRTGFQGTVHLFEPVPHLAELIPHTLAGLPLKYQVHNFALGEEEGETEIRLAADGNIGWNTLIAEVASDQMQSLPVKIRRFDSLPPIDRPCLVKVDVEGAEYMVLGGMLESISRWDPKPTILSEVSWGTQHPNWDRELAVFRKLEAMGYTVVGLDRKPVVVAEIANTTDVIFLPPRG